MRTRALAALMAVATLGSPRPAAAYEDRLTVELGAGPTLALRGSPSLGLVGSAAPGGGAHLGVTRGVGQSLSFAAELRYQGLSGDAAVHVLGASVGIVLALDVVTVVPRLELGVGPLVFVQPEPRSGLGGHLAVGFDRFVDAGLFGLDVRAGVLGPFQPSGDVVVTVGLVGRFAWVVDRY